MCCSSHFQILTATMESTLTSWGRLDPPRLRADVPRPAAGVVHRCRVRRAPRHVDLARGGGPPRGFVRLTVLSGSARRSFRVSPSLDLYFRLGKPWHRGLGASTESLDGFDGAGVAAPAVPRVLHTAVCEIASWWMASSTRHKTTHSLG